jgi:enoyl-CoA hydratase/carnithine racemase
VANRLALSSRLLTAAAAERRGLVNEVAPTGAGLAVARELAAEIIDGPPLAIAKAMAVLVQARSGEVDLADQAAVEALDALLVTTDAAEAYAARLEGRAPVWGGN